MPLGWGARGIDGSRTSSEVELMETYNPATRKPFEIILSRTSSEVELMETYRLLLPCF